MAQRFGGKYSPDGQDQATLPDSHAQGASHPGAGGRVNILFLAPLPLIWRAFVSADTSAQMALSLMALGLLLLAAWLTREGIIAQITYEARKTSRRPALPRKIAGSLLTGFGLAVASLAASGGLFDLVIFAVLGTVLHSFAFGFDPLTDKGMEGVNRFQTDRVAAAVDKAEAHLATMTDAIKRAGDRQAEARVAQFQASVRDMLRTVENDPRDLTSARKYIGVYLSGARDATIKFADINARRQNADARADYMALLTDLEENFIAKTRILLQDDQTDLDIEIDVLRDRLKRDGIRPESNS